MLKWISRITRVIKFLGVFVRVLVALLDALDPGNNHDNPIEKEIAKRQSSK